MSAPASVPVLVTPEAAARVAELGMRAELGQMIEHTRTHVPGLARLDVILEPAYDTGDTPYLTIRAFRPLPMRWDDRTRQEWGRWKVTTFPPEICQHIDLYIVEGGETSTLSLDGLPVPVILKPGAGERIEELGMQTEFRQMLEHLCRSVPGLRKVEVELVERYETGGEPGITIEAVTDPAGPPDTRARWDMGRWTVETFPPEVCEHFVLSLRPEESHAV
jgi:hypothetical protein